MTSETEVYQTNFRKCLENTRWFSFRRLSTTLVLWYEMKYLRNAILELLLAQPDHFTGPTDESYYSYGLKFQVLGLNITTLKRPNDEEAVL